MGVARAPQPLEERRSSPLSRRRSAGDARTRPVQGGSQMKLAVYDNHRVAVVEGDQLYDVTAAVPGTSDGWPPVFMSRLIAGWASVAPRIAEARRKATPLARSAVKLQSPVPFPGHV